MILALRLTEAQVGPAPLWELIFERNTIGRAPENSIRLVHASVSRSHAVIHREATGYVIELDASAASGAFLNGKRFQRAPLNDGDSLVIGRLLMKVFAYPPLDETKLRDYARAQPDDASRDVFVDWLETVGRDAEAAWLRAHLAVQRSDATTTKPELARLANRLSVADRAALASLPLRGCERAGCPANWSKLTLTPQPRLRTCNTCKREAKYCTQAAELAAAVGAPFVLE